jgi:hypothetical protein
MTARTASFLAAVLALALLGAPAAADPMKCSGEEKVCIAGCQKTAKGSALSLCLTNCGARLSYCAKTGCWDDGRQRYCGLLRQ